ncbi:MAG: YbaK/EbsC family protein [Armatimonadota bacterium]|nr:YbaK/EbsC family protein [Armatimonadota bacterium]MDR7532061.1 YbaK/EbsC family protein [Armatimonadota bacterium]MDR7535992.1 YbaK/EbsC family protein [Armatimonadota bacterium]
MRTRATRILDGLGIHYDLLEFDAEDYTAAEAAARLGLAPGQVLKTLVVRADNGPIVIACVPGDADLDLRALARLLGAKRATLVDAGELMRLVGYIKGAVSPLGQRRAHQVFVDSSALRHARISVSAGVRGLQLWMDPRDLVRATAARVEALTGRPRGS